MTTKQRGNCMATIGVFESEQGKYDWDKEDDLNDMISQKKLSPNIPTEFPAVPLESDYHLHISVEEFILENAASAVAATNADIAHGSLQDNNPSISSYYCTFDFNR